MEIDRKNAAAQNQGPPFVRACAPQHFRRGTLYGNLQEKCRGPEPRRLRTKKRQRSLVDKASCNSTFADFGSWLRSWRGSSRKRLSN